MPDVIASLRLLQSIFIRDDFPTFDLPIKANSGNFCFGFSEIRVLLPANSASVIFILNIDLVSVCKYMNYFGEFCICRMLFLGESFILLLFVLKNCKMIMWKEYFY